MSTLIATRLRLESGRLRQALLNPVGLTILAVSVLSPLVLLAVLGADEWLDRAFWLPLVGVLAYLATVVAYLFVEDWPADPEMWKLLVISRDMHSKLRQLQADRTGVAQGLVPTVAESIHKMDRQIVPDFRKIVTRRDKLERELRRYDEGTLPAPSAALLNRLRRIAADRRSAMTTIVDYAANTNGVLLELQHIEDTVQPVERAASWQADMEDIEAALAEVLRGYDPFETQIGLLQPGAALPSDLPEIPELAVDAQELARGDGPAEAVAAVGAPPAATAPRPRRRAYPDGLTRREAEVLALLSNGRQSTEIAEELVIAVSTVNRHILNVYDKTGARGRANATRYALRHDITWPLNDPGEGRAA